MNNKLYEVGLYIRLSMENTAYKGKDSDSIENQQSLLSKFVEMMPGWVEKRIYIDNGASGGNFNRKGFQEMMADVRSGFINLVLVKDLSRFGRNYIEGGKYLEEELPSLGCRFVALDDGIDTETGENDILPFLNAMNDFYLKNLSDRIRSALEAKARAGHKLCNVPYGYVRNPENRTSIIIDEYAGDVVKRMFALRASGLGYTSISSELSKDGILPPALYHCARENKESKRDFVKFWQPATVKVILRDEIYIGHTISCKHKSQSYRQKHMVDRPPDEWIRVENTHEPLIDIETWEKVQVINKNAKKRNENNREPEQSLFSKLLQCADCKRNLNYNRELHRRKSGAIVPYGSYHCPTYVRSSTRVCSRHTIYEIALKKIVLADIKRQAEMVSLNGQRILDNLCEKLNVKSKVSYSEQQKTLQKLEQRLCAIGAETEQLYENKVLGIIAAEVFTKQAKVLEAERADLESQCSLLRQSKEESKKKLGDIQAWMRLIQEKSTLKEVDRDLLEALIEKIEIGERTIINGVKTQEIKIFYRHVGLV